RTASVAPRVGRRVRSCARSGCRPWDRLFPCATHGGVDLRSLQTISGRLPETSLGRCRTPWRGRRTARGSRTLVSPSCAVDTLVDIARRVPPPQLPSRENVGKHGSRGDTYAQGDGLPRYPPV